MAARNRHEQKAADKGTHYRSSPTVHNTIQQALRYIHFFPATAIRSTVVEFLILKSVRSLTFRDALPSLRGGHTCQSLKSTSTRLQCNYIILDRERAREAHQLNKHFQFLNKPRWKPFRGFGRYIYVSSTPGLDLLNTKCTPRFV